MNRSIIRRKAGKKQKLVLVAAALSTGLVFGSIVQMMTGNKVVMEEHDVAETRSAENLNSAEINSDIDQLADTLDEQMSWFAQELEKLSRDTQDLLHDVELSEMKNSRVSSELDAQLMAIGERHKTPEPSVGTVQRNIVATSPDVDQQQSGAVSENPVQIDPTESSNQTTTVLRSNSAVEILSNDPALVQTREPLPEFTEPQSSELPQLGAADSDGDQQQSAGNDAGQTREEQLAELAISVGNTAQSVIESDAPVDVNEMLADRALQSGLSYGTNQLESAFDRYGKLKLDVGMDTSFNLETLSFDYFLPYSRSRVSTSFFQLGYRSFGDQNVLNLGWGYRQFIYEMMWGVNAFVDSDLLFEHQRASIGAELLTHRFHTWGNYYTPLSDWQDVGIEGIEQQSRPASGYDIGLKYRFERFPSLAASAEYFQWFGDHVDLAGDYQSAVTSSGTAYQQIEADPNGFDFTLEYRPFPLLAATVSQTLGSDQVSDFRVGLQLTYNLDQRWVDHLRPEMVMNSIGPEGMREAFVQRENNLILSYRDTPRPDGTSGLTVTIEESQLVAEGGVLTLNPEIESNFSLQSYLWSGDGAEYLSATDVANPVFEAPYWDPSNTSNEYPLTLTVMDEGGNTAESSMVVTVTRDQAFNPTVTFFSDQGNQDEVAGGIYSMPYGSLPTRIYWTIETQRTQTGKGAQLQEGVAYKWVDPNGVLLPQTAQDQYPAINTKAPAGSYDLALLTELVSSQEKSSVPVRVIIQTGTGTPLDVGEDLTVDYQQGETHTRQITGLDGGELRYRSMKLDVATVSPDPDDPTKVVITPVGLGTTQIAVHEGAVDNIDSESAYFNLTVAEGHSGLAWNDDGTQIINGTLTKTIADDVYIMDADTPFTDSYGDISYRKENDTSGVISTIDPISGQVTLTDAKGTARVIATQAADGAYRETSITYQLEVTDQMAELVWSDNLADGETVTHIFGSLLPHYTANPGQSTGDVHYYSETPQVADVDPKTGQVTVNSVGSTRIVAHLAPDGTFGEATIEYTLLVEKSEQNTSMSFADPGPLAKQFGDLPFTNELVLAHGSDGKVTYRSNNKDAADVNIDTGEVKIVAPGTATIFAIQADGTNYGPGIAQYVVEVSQGVSDLSWADPDAQTGVVVVPFGTQKLIYTASASEGNSTGKVTYGSTDHNVARIGPQGRLEMRSVGTTTISATQQAQGHYKETTVEFQLELTGGHTSNLGWTMDGVNNNRLQLPLDSDNYVVTADTTDKATGNVTYSVHSGRDVVAVDSVGNLTIRQRGQAILKATQEPSEGFEETTIYLVLDIVDGTNGISWVSGEQDGYHQTVPFGVVESPDSAVLHSKVRGNPIVDYRSSNSDIIEVNSQTGELTIKALTQPNTPVVITASQTGSSNFADSEITYSLEVVQAPMEQNVDLKWPDGIMSGDTVSLSYGKPHLVVAETPTVGDIPVRYESNYPDVVSVHPTSGLVTIGVLDSADVATITATVEPTAEYMGNSITYTVDVIKGAPAMVWQNPQIRGGELLVDYTAEPIHTPVLSKNKDVAIKYDVVDKTVATIDDFGTLTLVGGGTTEVVATQEANAQFEAGSTSYMLTVNPVDVALEWTNRDARDYGKVVRVYGDEAIELDNPVTESEPNVTYYSSNKDVATVDQNGLVSFVRAGRATITAALVSDSRFNRAMISYDLEIRRGDGLPLQLLNDPATFFIGRELVPDIQSNGGNLQITPQDELVDYTDEGTFQLRGSGIAKVKVVEPSDGRYKQQETVLELKIDQPYVVFSQNADGGGKTFKKYLGQNNALGGADTNDVNEGFADNTYNYFRLYGFSSNSEFRIYDLPDGSTSDDWHRTEFLCDSSETLEIKVDHNGDYDCYMTEYFPGNGILNSLSSYRAIFPAFVP